MSDILEDLWEQYATRARALIEDPPGADPFENPIDESIRWQIQRNPTFAPQAPETASLATLQLPELFSGEAAAPLAFVTVNPSYGGREIFPTVALLENIGPHALAGWFETRFAPEPSDTPMRHGRRQVRGKQPNPPACWDLIPDADDLKVVGRSQTTWTKLDWATIQCFPALSQAQQLAPLGRAARIFDIVPWKFAMWRKVNAELKRRFLDAGTPWLKRALDAHAPKVIVACGEDVRRRMRAMSGPSSDVPEYKAGGPQYGWFALDTADGVRRVRWFGIGHPGAPAVKDYSTQRFVDIFRRDIGLIAPHVREALAHVPGSASS